MLYCWPNHSLHIRRISHISAYVTLDPNIWHVGLLAQAEGFSLFDLGSLQSILRLSVKHWTPFRTGRNAATCSANDRSAGHAPLNAPADAQGRFTIRRKTMRCVVFTSTLVETQYDARIDSSPIRAFPCVAFLRQVFKKPLLRTF